MASHPLTGLSTPQLDGYLKGIRDEFDRLNYELEEMRKQRDEYVTKCTPRLTNAICHEQRSLIQIFLDNRQANELRELRQTIARREDPRVCITDDNPSPLISRASSPSEYYSPLEMEEERGAASDRLSDPESLEMTPEPTIAGVSFEADADVTSTNEPGYSSWDVELNSDTTGALQLNLAHKLTQEGRIYLTFSMDGKYLATASISGILSIFDAKSGKRIR
jgi:hypothetical protein